MKTTKFFLVLLLLVGQVYGDKKEVNEAVDEFYKALNAMFTGDLIHMKSVWSHADDVTYMGPGGGFQKGWSQVLNEWEKQAAMNLGGAVHPKDLVITVGQDLAIVSNYEIGKNNDASGTMREVKIRATNTFRKEDGVWKMIGHHTDLLPYLAK